MKGVVHLIGGGPGSPDLLSLRGLRLLRRADLIVMDILLPETYLSELGIAGKEVIRPTFDPKDDFARQVKINRMLVEAAKDGKRVARLKCGDPYLFGRGWEEALVLDEHEIPWEVVPGITSAMAVPAGAAVPVTTRNTSRSVAFVTARLAGGDPNRRMPKADTVVVLMGMKVLPELSAHFAGEGWLPETPVCVIQRGSQPGEAHVKGTLADIAGKVAEAGLKPPGIVVIGAAAGRQELQNEHPHILFVGQDPTPVRLLGEVLHWPMKRFVPRDVPLDGLMRENVSLLLLGSLSVRAFLGAFVAAGKDLRDLAGVRLIADNGVTAEALLDAGLRADAVGIPGAVQGKLIILGDAEGVEGLQAELPSAEGLVLHDVEPAFTCGKPLPDHEAICFESKRELGAFLEAYGEVPSGVPVWSLDGALRIPETRIDRVIL